MKNFKKRWNIQHNYQLVLIFIVFAITGSSSVFVGDFIMNVLNISKDNFHIILFYIIKSTLITIVYQVLLLFYGFVFGQIDFFWNFEKKLLRTLGLGFLFK
jgi:hypothetical protein